MRPGLRHHPQGPEEGLRRGTALVPKAGSYQRQRVADVPDGVGGVLGNPFETLGVRHNVVIEPLARVVALPVPVRVFLLHGLPRPPVPLEEAHGEGRAHGGGVDHTHRDVPHKQLDPQRVGVPFHGELGGVVRGVAGQADQPIHTVGGSIHRAERITFDSDQTLRVDMTDGDRIHTVKVDIESGEMTPIFKVY